MLDHRAQGGKMYSHAHQHAEQGGLHHGRPMGHALVDALAQQDLNQPQARQIAMAFASPLRPLDRGDGRREIETAAAEFVRYRKAGNFGRGPGGKMIGRLEIVFAKHAFDRQTVGPKFRHYQPDGSDRLARRTMENKTMQRVTVEFVLFQKVQMLIGSFELPFETIDLIP